MIRFFAFMISILWSAVFCNAQSFSALSDSEVSALVRAESRRDLLRLWTVSDSGSQKRLRVCYFPPELLDDNFLSELNDWIRAQSEVEMLHSIEQRIRKAFPNSVSGDVTALNKALINLARDSSRKTTSRVAAVLTTTSFDSEELYECLGLTASCLKDELKSSAQSQANTDWDLVVRVLQSSERSLVFANLLILCKTLKSKDATDDDVRNVFASLRRGEFNVPFMVDEGDRRQNRLIIAKAEVYNPSESGDRYTDVNISTTDFSVLEEYRYPELWSFPRGLRSNLFNDIFGEIKVRVRSIDAESRLTYLLSIEDDLALIASRLLQCDSQAEILSVGAHLSDCIRCADLKDMLESPIKVPNDVRGASCFKLIKPEHLLGRRTTDFYANCSLAASLGKKWELSLLSDVFDVHPKNDSIDASDDSPPER